MRPAEIERNTMETQIKVQLDLDGTGTYDIQTGCGFLTICWRSCPVTA